MGNNRKISIPGDFILDIKFSPDSKSFAYIEALNKKIFVGVNGKEGDHGYDYISNLQFSDDSRFLSYGTLLNGDFFWKVDLMK